MTFDYKDHGKEKFIVNIEDCLTFEQEVSDDDVILVPADTWHNVTNIGDKPLKIYSIYAGPDHVPGTVHKTHEEAKNDPNED